MRGRLAIYHRDINYREQEACPDASRLDYHVSFAPSSSHLSNRVLTLRVGLDELVLLHQNRQQLIRQRKSFDSLAPAPDDVYDVVLWWTRCNVDSSRLVGGREVVSRCHYGSDGVGRPTASTSRTPTMIAVFGFGLEGWEYGVEDWSLVGRRALGVSSCRCAKSKGSSKFSDLVGGLVARQRWGNLGLWKSWQL